MSVAPSRLELGARVRTAPFSSVGGRRGGRRSSSRSSPAALVVVAVVVAEASSLEPPSVAVVRRRRRSSPRRRGRVVGGDVLGGVAVGVDGRGDVSLPPLNCVIVMVVAVERGRPMPACSAPSLMPSPSVSRSSRVVAGR